MTKNLLKWAICLSVGLLAALGVYLLSAFIAWDLNPAHWSDEHGAFNGRVLTAITMIAVFILSFVGTKWEIEKYDKNR